VYVLPVHLHPSAKLGFCHRCFTMNEVPWTPSQEHSCPQCVSLEGTQYSHFLLHTSLLLAHVTVFASASNTLSVYRPWFNLGTCCSFLLMTGDLRAGVSRFVDMSQVSLRCQKVVLWYISATSTFAKIVSLQNVHHFKQPPPMTKAPPVCRTPRLEEVMPVLFP